MRIHSADHGGKTEGRRVSINIRQYYFLLYRYRGDVHSIPAARLELVRLLNIDDPELAFMMGKIAYEEFTEIRNGKPVVVTSQSELKRGTTLQLPF